MFARTAAGRHSVTGWIKNLKSGEVEIIAEGQEDKLIKFYKEVERGPMMATIMNIKKEELTATGEFERFDILL